MDPNHPCDAVKRHPRTAIWQLSCSAHSQTIRKSLMTTDETAARLAALDYYQAQREHIGLAELRIQPVAVWWTFGVSRSQLAAVLLIAFRHPAC